MWYLKYNSNELTYKMKRLKDIANKFMITEGERG